MAIDDDKQKALDDLHEFSNVFTNAMKEIEGEEEAFWNSLSTEQQLMCFNSVVRRIHKGEIDERGTYRYVLYNVFGFGPEAYVRAQCAGYLNIHNSIFTALEEEEQLKQFARVLGQTEEQAKDTVSNFLLKRSY